MSSIIIGEIGESISIQANTPLKKTFDKYLSDFHLTQNDCVIFDSKGQLVFNFSPQMSSETDSKFYIYTKIFEKGFFSNYFDEVIQRATTSCALPISINPNNIPDIHTNYSLIEEKSKMLKIISASDIKFTFEKMLEFFENFKVIHKTLTINSKICEKIKECYQYQYCGIKCMIKYMNNVLDICDNSREDVKNEYNKLLEIKESSLKMLEDGLNTLKKTELHPKMQTNNNKFLIDLYFDEEKMNIWIESRVEHTKHFAEVIAEKNKLYVNESNKIMNEKNTSIADIKNEWNNLGGEYDKIIKDLEESINLIFSDISNEFLDFKKALNKIIEIITNNFLQSSQNDSPTSNYNAEIEQACGVILKLKTKYSNFSILGSLEESLEPINDLCSKMRKSMERFPSKINLIFLNFINISNNLVELSEKFNKYKVRMLSLEESFSSFKNPSHFPKAYLASIDEIKRRILFNKILLKDFDLLNSLVFAENTARKEFIQNYGKYLPVDYFPSLRFSNLQLGFDFQNENELDLYPNLLSEEEEKKITAHSLMPNLYGQNFPSDANGLDNLKKTRTILNLQNEIEKSSSFFQTISENFLSTISVKDQLLREKTIECENLAKKLFKKNGNKTENCPMCYESSINSIEYQTWMEYSKDMQNKIQIREKEIFNLEKQIQELVSQTNQIKTLFFSHMNFTVAEKNVEIISLKNKITTLENFKGNDDENQKYKKLYEEEKNKNASYLTDLRLIQAKFDNSVLDYKKLESKLEETKLKQTITNDKLLQIIQENQKIKKENETFKSNYEEAKLKLIQLENLLKISQNDNNGLKLENQNLLKEKQKLSKEIASKQASISTTMTSNPTNTKNELSDDIIQIKRIDKGSRCIFVPHSEGIYTCINLSNPIHPEGEEDLDNYYKCDFILDLNSFNEEMKDLIVENSLIVIGVIEELSPYNPSTNTYNLPDGSTFTIATLKKIDYVIGFPGEELLFRDYNINEK